MAEQEQLPYPNSPMMEQLIEKHEGYILRCASEFTGRYITKSDDEWSVALFGFAQAIQDYDPEKGGFLSFATLVMERRLTDYVRKQARYRNELSVDPADFELEPQEEELPHSLRLQIAPKLAVSPDDRIRLEIEAVGETLQRYGFSFYDLTACSPKAGKTKNACAQAVTALVRNLLLMQELRATRMLPMKNLAAFSGVSRKILERHRKYIIAAAEIITGDYPCLVEYLSFIREELNK